MLLTYAIRSIATRKDGEGDERKQKKEKEKYDTLLQEGKHN